MKHKNNSTTIDDDPLEDAEMTEDELRAAFAQLFPHVPLQAYDEFLSQYAPRPTVQPSSALKHTQTSIAKRDLKMSRKKEGDEMYELIPSRDLQFLLPGDSLTVFSHKSFPEQFEFTLHYIDKATGEVRSVVAPHQSRLRALLTIARPPAQMRGTVPGQYNQVTFTAPSNGKTTYSGFVGSFFKKAAILDHLPELSAVEIPNPPSPASSSSSTSSSSSSSAVKVVKKRSSAPTTPSIGSPRSGSDDAVTSATFWSAPPLNSAFSSPSLTSPDVSNSASALLSPPVPRKSSSSKTQKRLMPVAMSFRTKVTSNGVESIHTSPLFVVCETVDQVDMKVCRAFRHTMTETYPSPPSVASDCLPAPRLPSTSSATTSSKKTKSEPKAEKSDKAEKKTHEKSSSTKQKRSKHHHIATSDAPASTKADSNTVESDNAQNSNIPPATQSKSKLDRRRSTTTSTSDQSSSTSTQPEQSEQTTAPTSPRKGSSKPDTTETPSAPCKTEIQREESHPLTSRFQALKFW